MIREFALEPEIITSWDSFCRFTGDFGVPLGRLIASYPTYWEVLLWQHVKQLDMNDSQRKLIEVKMGSPAFRRKLAPREGAKFNKANTWVENARIEHTRKPFDAIVAAANPDNRPEILVADELDPSDPRWQPTPTRTILRSADAIAEAAWPLLRISREIVFVDRYFRPTGRHLAPLLSMLAAIGSRELRRLEYHLGEKQADDPQRFWGKCDRELAKSVPQGVGMRLVLWPQDLFHDRYVLTELGGLVFSTGLDTGDQPPEQTVSLLGLEDHRRIWESFTGGSGPQPLATHEVTRHVTSCGARGRAFKPTPH